MVGPVSSAAPHQATDRRSGPIRSPAALLVLLTALNLLNYLDRYVMAAVLAKVQDDLHLSNFIGGSLATVFLIGYFATSPIFGTLADRAPPGGRARLLMVGVSVWSAATIASGLVRSAAALVCARAFVGVGEASYITIAPTFIDDVAKPAQRGRWMAIFSAALPLGSALGYIVGGAVEHSHGWRSAFFVAGAPGLVLALLCLLIAEPPRRSSAPVPDVRGSARILAKIPVYRGGVLGYCAYTFAIGGFAFWAPKYLHERYGLETGHAAVQFGFLTVAGGFVGTLVGGWLGDRSVRMRAGRAAPGQGVEAVSDDITARANLLVCALSAGLGAPLAALAITAPSARGFFVFAFPCEVALFLSNGPVNVALLRSVPAGLRASAMALAVFAIHLLGDLWSPPLIGLTADFAPAAYGLTPMAWAMMLVPVFFGIGALVWRRASRRASGAPRSG